MAQTSCPQRSQINRFQVDSVGLFPIPEDVDARVVERCNRNFAIFKALPQPKRYQRHRKSEESLKSNPPTTTPENQKLSPIVPNAPIKQRKNTMRMYLRRKKLEYMEPEVEDWESLDSGISSPPKQFPSSLWTGDDHGVTNNSKRKLRSSTRRDCRKNLPKCDKENVRDTANSPETQQGHSSKIGQTSLTKNHSKLIVSQNRSKLEESNYNDHDNELENGGRWLELHQDDGTWIMCCHNECGKWRIDKKYKDPAEVPDKWFCHMNNNPDFASCDVAEEKIPDKVSEELIETKYRIGSIVWARLDGYPWSPAMIHDCPTQFRFCEFVGSSTIPIKYHVVWFNSTKIQYSWIKDRDLKAYVKNATEKIVKKTKFRTIDFNERLDDACALANNAVLMSPSQRLERFGLVARCSQKSLTKSKNLKRKRNYRCLARYFDRSLANVNSELASEAAIRESMEKRYNVGDIVWSHPKGNPWWPAMIDYCPYLCKHYKFPESVREPIEYHVVYFNNENTLEYDWQPERNLKLFSSNPGGESMPKKTTYGKTDYRHKLKDACALAQEAKELSPNQCLKRFGVMQRLSVMRKEQLSVTVHKTKENFVSEVSSETRERINSQNHSDVSKCIRDASESNSLEECDSLLD